jgi:pyruvate/2-oxoglutarate dehydrogenase complex dihydrolipoamide acyltransferase (E2) component
MAVPIHAPRVNNNDDTVRVVAFNVARGDRVTSGQVICQVETDKATIDIEAPGPGFILAILPSIDEDVAVGSVLMWLGDAADEPVPLDAETEQQTKDTIVAAPTAKARVLLRRYGLTADAVAYRGERLTANDVEAHVARHGRRGDDSFIDVARSRSRPTEAGNLRPLRGDERAMIKTVSWSREAAVPGYIELEYDPSHWERYAKQFSEQRRLMLTPLLSLMAWRMVQLVVESPVFNSTIYDDHRYEYSQVNLGFTVQADETLYLTVVRDAATMDEDTFVRALGDIQRRAMSHRLASNEVQGATVAFSSMARWKVSRHVPILPPHTAIIVAHAATAAGRDQVLGATYDHRILTGLQVVTLLRKLTTPLKRISKGEEE